MPIDVAQFDQVDQAATAAEDRLGPIDVWVNNAMTTVFSPLSEIRPEDFQRAVEVTFLGQVWGTMAALQRMRPRNRGHIVNVGSALAFIGIPLQSAYCSSKFACRGFSESVRAELIHDRSDVRMSMVHLPAVNTPQFDWCETTLPTHPQPVPPIYEPEIPANAIVQAVLHGRRSKVLGSWNKLLVVVGSSRPEPGQPIRRHLGVGIPVDQPTVAARSSLQSETTSRPRLRLRRPRRIRRSRTRVPGPELPENPAGNWQAVHTGSDRNRARQTARKAMMAS